MRGFFALAFSFALLLVVWEKHYRFFRRYGLQDETWHGAREGRLRRELASRASELPEHP
jgi:hypothetical protein